MLQNRVVFSFGVEICSSVSADRIVMAASRLLGATAACVILLSFAAGHRKLYWNGCIVSVRISCVVIFLLNLFLKSASKWYCRKTLVQNFSVMYSVAFIVTIPASFFTEQSALRVRSCFA